MCRGFYGFLQGGRGRWGCGGSPGDLTRRSSPERRRFEAEVVIAGFAGGDGAHAIQIDNEFSVAAPYIVKLLTS
jgi:hypothetical protein